jgi:vitamin B12 transporter
MMKNSLRAIILALLLGPMHTVFPVQQIPVAVSRIEGVVTDENNAPLSYANVYLQETMEGTMSDDEGRFSFSSRAVGKVTFVCSYIGYKMYTQTLTLSRGQVLTLSFALEQQEIKTRSVTVTASAFTAADEEGVTLTAMEIVRTPGAAADVFWAVKSFPGLQQVEEGAGLFVRGGDVSETVVLLDGAVIKHPYKYESPTGGFFGTFSPFLLKGTFFSSGGFSAQYGNALSGALAMESHDLPERRQMGFGVGLAAESVYLALPIVDNKFGLNISGNVSNTKMLFEMNKTRKDFSRYPSSYDVNLSGIYKFDNQNAIKFFHFREDDKIGVEIDDPDYATHFHGNTSNRLYNVKYSGLMGKELLLNANVAYSRFRRDMNLSVLDLDIEDRMYQLRITGEREVIHGLHVRSGLALFRFQTRVEGTVPQEEEDLDPNAPTDRVDTDYTSDRAAPFVETEWFGPFGIRFTVGLRGEYESISGVTGIDPRASISMPILSHSDITFAWGCYRQYPDPMYYDPYIGNPQLSAGRATHYILGYAYQRQNRIFRVEAYYKKYSGLLLEDEVENYINDGYGYAKGVDVFVKQSMGRVSGWMAYSWLHARRKWMDLPVLASPYFDITHNITTVLNVDLPHHFSMGCSFRYATGKPYSPGPDEYHTLRVPSYKRIDVTLTYLHSFFESNVTVFYMAVSNVLGRINVFDYRYSSDWQRRDAVESSFGRFFYFGVSVNM